MEHVRTSASKEVVRTLTGIPGIKGAAARRRWSYNASPLPAINVHWEAEQRGPTHGTPGRRLVTRSMTLRVNIVASVDDETQQTDPSEYEFDALQGEVERRLAANLRLAGPDGKSDLVREVLWDRTQTGESTKGATAGVLVTALFFTVLTHYREGLPTHPLQDCRLAPTGRRRPSGRSPP